MIRNSVKLKGKSRHGKNRINQFGDSFTIADIRSHIATTAHRACIGPFAFLHCTEPNLLKGSRWIALSDDDPDFEVVK